MYYIWNELSYVAPEPFWKVRCLNHFQLIFDLIRTNDHDLDLISDFDSTDPTIVVSGGSI